MAKKPKNESPIPDAETRPAAAPETRGADAQGSGDATKGAERKGDGAAETKSDAPATETKPDAAKADKPKERRVEPGSQVEFRVVSQFIEEGRLYQKDEGCMLTPERARQLGKGLVEPFPA